ncbi:MAG: hypothetical protein OEY38_13500, partial [Gammaproteobacteria bacterium]|nr:hypothetical protein [Gammaproteobacteria bacterium]
MQNYQCLPYATLPQGALLKQHHHLKSNSVKLSDPAIVVMTDLSKGKTFAIGPNETIQKANDTMIACGVRLLFVRNSDDSVMGLITATDILGEKPIRYLNEHGGSRNDILVQDVMTPKVLLE